MEQDKANKELAYEIKLEKQLADLLRQVNGVGDVEVMITLEDKFMIEPAFNIVDTEKIPKKKIMKEVLDQSLKSKRINR